MTGTGTARSPGTLNSRTTAIPDDFECVVAVGMVWAEAPYNLSEISKEADELMYEDKKRKKKPGEEIR